MIRIAILIAALATSSCAALPVTPNEESKWAAVVAAEAFVARHGYTAAGHPPDQPIVSAEIFDILSSPNALVASRNNTLERRSFGLRSVGDNDHYVLFRMTQDSEKCRVVLVQKEKAVQMLHDPVSVKSQRWQPVQHAAPPNNSFNPMALRGTG